MRQFVRNLDGAAQAEHFHHHKQPTLLVAANIMMDKQSLSPLAGRVRRLWRSLWPLHSARWGAARATHWANCVQRQSLWSTRDWGICWLGWSAAPPPISVLYTPSACRLWILRASRTDRSPPPLNFTLTYVTTSYLLNFWWLILTPIQASRQSTTVTIL
jgi:hypothetical protein